MIGTSVAEISSVGFGTAFLAGLVTVLSPCVLVMLPIIVGTGLQRRWWYPLIVSIGLAFGFAVMGVFLSQLLASAGLSQGFMGDLTTGVLFVFGGVLLVDRASDAFSGLATRALAPFTQRLGGVARPDDVSGFSGAIAAFVLGCSLGLVWAPCAGPTMGAILTVAATQSLSQAFFLMAVYAAGNALPMLLVAYGGRAVAQRMLRLQGTHHVARKILGGLLIFFAVLSAMKLDKLSERELIRSFPNFFDWVASY